ncbi:hypothetical protein [Streptomyces sp. NK08204]|uniref:hypothetical protein n=1 Tax=Streptomyces sp. NK08204 TaxID=2873260 RepID=UPI001CEDB804|nr:hypothetical protein [Streptomyces sp. NK08204]
MTRRSARRSVHILGVASAAAALALGVAGSALAGTISEFSAEATCDGGKGVIVVTVKDISGTPAVMFLKSDAGVETPVGRPQEVRGSAEGTSVAFTENGKPHTAYRVHVKAGHQVDQYINPDLKTPGTPCKARTKTPKPPATQAPSTSAPAESAAPAPPASAAGSTPAGTSDNVPSPAAGDSNLAETGTHFDIGLIAGVAGALVVVGGGALFFGVRRRGTKSDN